MMAARHLLVALVPLALAACATTGTVSKKQITTLGQKVVEHPASMDTPKRKASPYAPAAEDLSKRGNYVAGGLYLPGVSDTVPDEIPDVDAIPEPEVREEPRSRGGNRDYSVLGKRYKVMGDSQGYVETGLASYYGNKFHGRLTSNQEVYDMYAFTAAHKTLPLPSYARVTNLDNGKSIVVRINDRGPFHAGRVIDLSYAAAVKLGYRDRGTARVEVRALAAANIDTSLAKQQSAAEATAMDKLVDRLPEALAHAGQVATAPIKPSAAEDNTNQYRFDMRQDGRVMQAQEFDAWMMSRRVRVATGKPGIPDPLLATPGATETAKPLVGATPPSPFTAAALVAATAPARTAPGDSVMLQVASFSNAQNAQHALALLQGAAIGNAQLLDADVNGKKIWRLRVGPVASVTAPELAARMVGLGFGQPQRVRD